MIARRRAVVVFAVVVAAVLIGRAQAAGPGNVIVITIDGLRQHGATDERPVLPELWASQVRLADSAKLVLALQTDPHYA